MENTSSKTGYLGPVVLKFGIPLALSAAGGICAIMMARGSFPASLNLLKPRSKVIENSNFYSHNWCSFSIPLEDEGISETEEQKPKVEKKVIRSLKGRVEELEKREAEIERQFIWYQNLKEREALLVELRNTLVLDMAHISFLEKEVLLMEEESKRFESLVSEYLGVAEQLEGQKTENKLLVREVKKLKKRLKEQSKMIREKNLKIEDCKTKLEMETKKRMLEKLENEVREVKMQMVELQEERNRALSTLKIKEEKSVTIEKFDKLSNEVNQLKDAIEILRKQEQEQEQQNRKEAERNHKGLGQKELSSDKTNPTRPKLLQRISCVGGK